MSAHRIVVLFLVCAVAVFAQSDRGTITGTVSDPAQAVVPGATVQAVNSEAGTQYQTVTTATGNFTLPSLPAGVYDVNVSAPGFSKSLQQGIRVQVAQTIRVDFLLQVGSTSDTVTVTADAPLLRTENAEQSMNVGGDRINALPLNFGGGGGSTGSIRNWLSFIVLAPGVSGTTERASVNGAPGGAFKIYVEGQDITSSNDTVWTSVVSSAAVETIGEFSLQTSNFAAEFGQVIGGLFNFTTKSGSNQVHGSAFEYFTNEALDSHRPFTGARPRSRKNDFGFTLGGPVYIPKLYNGRDRTFFFFNLEMFRNVTLSAGSYNTVPTSAYRAGDFSAALTGRQLATDGIGRPILENVIYDPGTSRVVNGKVYRDPFSGNKIGASLLDPVAVKVQSLLPQPDLPNEIVLNWQQRTPNHKYQAIPSVKIDHNLGSLTKLSFYWSVQNTDQITSPDGLPIPITARRDQKIYGHTTRLNFDRSLTPTFLIHAGVGYLRFHNPDSSPGDVLSYDAVKGIGFTGSVTNPSGFPRITGLSGGRGGMGPSLGPTNANAYYNDKATAVASATYIRGNHTYKTGVEFKQEVWTDINKVGGQGVLNFNVAETGLPATQGQSLGGGSIGLGYASFLMGRVNNANVQAVKDPQWRKKGWGLYVQDTWKIARKLTLDYGLRWDYSGQGHEIYWRNSQIGLNTPNPTAGGLAGGIVYEGYGPGRCNCTFTNAYPYAIGPRLGIAYQLSPKTVLRGGWALTYSALPNWWYITGGSSTLGVGFDAKSWSTPAYGEPGVILRNGLPVAPGELTTPSLNPGLRPSAGQLDVPPAWGGQITDRNGARPARVNQWNVAVQRELSRDLSLEVAYVGNRGAWLEANGLVNYNAISEERLRAFGLDMHNAADRSLLISRIDSPLAAQRGFKAPYSGFPGSATVAQSLRPYPMYNNGLGSRWAPLGNNWYDSLQTKVTKRYSHGLDMSAAFTWQKELARGTGGNPGAGGGGINNVFNRDNQKSLTGSSQPLILVVGFNYQTPRAGGSRLVQLLTGNWVLGGILRYSSGSLISVPGSQNSLSSVVYQNTRFNRVPGEPLFIQDPGCKCINPNQDFVLNPKAWSDAPAGEWGYSAPYYNDYRWQRGASEQISLGRTFTIKERMTLQLRAEFFNAFNRLNLPNPASSNPSATKTYNAQGIPTGGFGYINATSTGGQRNGQLVARFQF